MNEQTIISGGKGHETRDFSVPLVSWTALGLFFGIAVIAVGIVGLYKLLEHVHPSKDPPSRIELHPHPIAPAPRLQSQPTVEFENYQRAEEKILNSYGWVDQKAGIVRLPIERAMDLVAERGLPTRGPGTKNTSGITPEQLQQQKAVATAPKR